MCASRGHKADKRGRFGLKVAPTGFGGNCFNCGFRFRYEYVTPSISKALNQFMQALGIPNKTIKSLKFGIFKGEQNLPAITDELDTPYGNLFVQPVDDFTKMKHGIAKTMVNETPDFQAVQTIESKYAKNMSAWADNAKRLPLHSRPINDFLDDIAKGAEPSRGLLKCLEYLESRDLIDYDKIFWHDQGSTVPSLQRFILPYYHQNEIVGYTSRVISDGVKGAIKYIKAGPPGFVYNYHLFARAYAKQYVVLYEGVLDAFVMQGISGGGNNLTADQQYMINALGKTVIVVPDNDAAGDVLVQTAIENNWQVAFPVWGKTCKDAAESAQRYGRIYTLQDILATAETDHMTITLKRGLK